MRNFGGFLEIFDFGTILDWCVIVWGGLRIIGIRVAEFDKKAGNVVNHCEAESVIDVVPVKVYAIIQIAFPILGDIVMFLEYITEMRGMSFAHVFDAKSV